MESAVTQDWAWATWMGFFADLALRRHGQGEAGLPVRRGRRGATRPEIAGLLRCPRHACGAAGRLGFGHVITKTPLP